MQGKKENCIRGIINNLIMYFWAINNFVGYVAMNCFKKIRCQIATNYKISLVTVCLI